MRGVQSRPENTLLTEKAAKYLEAGPADVVDLIGYICNLPAAPRIVAEHMADAMFAGRTEFGRDAAGKWRLVVDASATSSQSFNASVVMQPQATGYKPQTTDHYPRISRTRGREATPKAPSQSLKSVSWVVVDVETTGGLPPSHRITEIAAVVVKDGKIADVFETLVNPERPIPNLVSKITNITWDMVKNAPKFSHVAANVMRALEGNVFVAHNAAFDWKFVTHEVTRATGNRLVGQQLCTVKLARCLLPNLTRRSLDYLANYYGVEIRGRHRAGGDAIATAHCLIRMLDDAEDRGCITWEDLDLLLGRRTAKKKKRRRYSALPAPVTKDTTA
jgi:exonuclease, DNA polymerase III, epsilon subunit family